MTFICLLLVDIVCRFDVSIIVCNLQSRTKQNITKVPAVIVANNSNIKKKKKNIWYIWKIKHVRNRERHRVCIINKWMKNNVMANLTNHFIAIAYHIFFNDNIILFNYIHTYIYIYINIFFFYLWSYIFHIFWEEKITICMQRKNIY